MAQEKMVLKDEHVSNDTGFNDMSIAQGTDTESGHHAYGQSVHTEEKLQCKNELCEGSDSSTPSHNFFKGANLISLAVRTKLPGDIDTTVKLHASNDDALSSNRKTKVTPPSDFEQTPITLPLHCKNLAQEQSAISGKRKRESSPEAPKLELYNALEGRFDAWQLRESVNAFLERLPPSRTPASKCAWIWADNPHRNPRDKTPCPRVDYFNTSGMKLVEQYIDKCRNTQDLECEEERNIQLLELVREGKFLENQIASLARETRFVSGKWTFFVKAWDVDRVWKQIVTGVIENRLGSSCKVGTDDGCWRRLVCVYTKDFEDTKDVLRVLQELKKMGLVSTSRPAYYVPDAYTHLQLGRGRSDRYYLKWHLYDSRSMLAANEALQPSSAA